MTAFRLIFWGIAAFFCLAGLGTGNRIFFVLFFIQVFLAACAFIMNIWAAFSFSYLQSLSAEKILRGRDVTLHLSVHNEKFIPYPLMRVHIATPDRHEKKVLEFNLSAHSSHEFNIPMACRHRGEYVIGMTVIDFVDVFGLLQLPFDMRLLPYYRSKKLLVFPRLIMLKDLALHALDSKSFSRSISATEDSSEPFSMIRDYHRGDLRKQIHWKASVRSQKLMTRLFEQSSEPRIMMMLDLNRPPFQNEASSQSADVCCECAAALVQYILRQRWPLEVISFGRERQVVTARQMKDFQNFYRWLASVDFNGTSPFLDQFESELSALKKARAVLVITPRLDADVPSAILRQHRALQKPIYTIFALPAAGTESIECQVSEMMKKYDLPAWFIHDGDDLAECLGKQP